MMCHNAVQYSTHTPTHKMTNFSVQLAEDVGTSLNILGQLSELLLCTTQMKGAHIHKFWL